MAKADKDGWIRHRGGKCPVQKGTLVDVRYRDGNVNEHVKALTNRNAGGSIKLLTAVNWKHGAGRHDIMAYRIHKPAEQQVYDCEPDLSHLSTPLVINMRDPHPENPLIWRDRIREIDRNVEALEEERVSLIQRLEGEGLQLLQAKSCGSVQPVEDTSDRSKWKDGDLVECISNNVASCERMTVGGLYKVKRDGDQLEIIDDDGDSMGAVVKSSRIRWHSRPSA